NVCVALGPLLLPKSKALVRCNPIAQRRLPAWLVGGEGKERHLIKSAATLEPWSATQPSVRAALVKVSCWMATRRQSELATRPTCSYRISQLRLGSNGPVLPRQAFPPLSVWCLRPVWAATGWGLEMTARWCSRRQALTV